MQRFKRQLHFIQIMMYAIGFSIGLLGIRFIKTGSTLYFFLLWNLFLAMIPYGIALILRHKQCVRYPLLLWSGILVWLLFLPNAPYLLTDIKHIKHSTLNAVWFDTVLILSFALNGVILGFASLKIIEQLLRKHYSKRITKYIVYFTLFCCGFGIYLGRVLRWNSWDVLTHPLSILGDIGKRVIFPLHYIDTWVFTLSFSFFLIIIYQVIQYHNQHSLPRKSHH